MKKVFLSLFGVLAVSIASAAVNAPKDTKGASLATVDFVGALPCNIDASTGTGAVLCGSANKRGIVYGILYTGINPSTYLVFRDTNTANLTSSTAAVVYASTAPGINSGSNATGFIKFPVPIRFTNGIAVNSSVAPTSGLERWTILYRPTDSSVSGD